MAEQKNIVVIGGGFAGTTLARELDGKLPTGYQLLVISEESYTTFNPLLAEAVGASIFPEQVVAPIREMLVRGRFIMGRVTAIDTAAKSLSCASLAGNLDVDYKHLIIAIGNRARLDLIPGLADRLLPELSERLGAAAQRSLARRGVDVRTGAKATAISDRSITLADGTAMATAAVICTIGTRPNPLVDSLGLATERGRIVVDPDLSVRAAPGLWAMGDCAQVPNAHDGSYAPPTAQFAVREARCLARNLLAVLSRQQTQPFDYRARGSMAAVGHLNGVADVCGVPLTGIAAWLLWRAYYLSQMPTFGRKLRIFVEWTWGMFFPTDITHLRFTRSHQLADQAG